MSFRAGTRRAGIGGSPGVTDHGLLLGLADDDHPQYEDAIPGGNRWKQPVRVATVAAGTLATSFENGDTIDGVVLATGDAILIKDQASAIENGLYLVNASGAPTRRSDADGAGELDAAAVLVEEGTVNADTGWIQTSDNVTPGTHANAWTQFNAAGAAPIQNTFFGSGSDGDVTIAAPTTLTRPMFYNNLTVNAALTVAGHGIYVKGTLTIGAAGTIIAPGTAAATGAAGAGGVGGVSGFGGSGAAAGYTIGGSVFGEGGGGGFGDGGTAPNGSGAPGGASPFLYARLGGIGGASGAGGTSGGAGGAGAASEASATFLKIESLHSVFRAEVLGVLRGGASGACGGGGGAGATGGGGGGGGGSSAGGVVVIFANTFNNLGAISVAGGAGATGGAGEAPDGGGGGGSGGGGGGYVYLVYSTLTALGTITRTGGAAGAAGAGFPAGAVGSAGAAGGLCQIDLTAGTVVVS